MQASHEVSVNTLTHYCIRNIRCRVAVVGPQLTRRAQVTTLSSTVTRRGMETYLVGAPERLSLSAVPNYQSTQQLVIASLVSRVAIVGYRLPSCRSGQRRTTLPVAIATVSPTSFHTGLEQACDCEVGSHTSRDQPRMYDDFCRKRAVYPEMSTITSTMDFERCPSRRSCSTLPY